MKKYVAFIVLAMATHAYAVTEEWVVLPNSSLRATLKASPWIVVPGPDGYTQDMNNILISWSSGAIFTRPNGEQWVVIKNGGHNSWYYNDVWGYQINGSNPHWQNLRKSYLPYVTVFEWDGNTDPNTGFWDGSPRFVGMNPY